MAITERYGLSKSSRKHKCPGCGRMTFTYYIDRGYDPSKPEDKALDLQMVDGEYILGTDYGWCDRENNCGYHSGPKDFFKDRKVNGNTYQKAFKPIEESPKEIIPIDKKYVCATMFYPNGKYRLDSTLMQYLLTLPFTDQELQTLADVVGYYRVGVCKNVVNKWNAEIEDYVSSEGNGIVFWMIDVDQRIRAGKLMYYHSDGHRDHLLKPQSIKYTLIERGELPKGYDVAQCLYGEHLLKETHFDGMTVGIVESEKTALICAIIVPKFLWMACSSKGCISEQHLQPLKDHHRNIVLFPDRDGYWLDEDEKALKHCTDEKERRKMEQRKKQAWNLKAKELQKWYTKISCTNYVLNNATEVDGKGCDIGDILIRKTLERVPTPPEPDYGIPMTEPLKKLIEKFDLIKV